MSLYVKIASSMSIASITRPGVSFRSCVAYLSSACGKDSSTGSNKAGGGSKDKGTSDSCTPPPDPCKSCDPWPPTECCPPSTPCDPCKPPPGPCLYDIRKFSHEFPRNDVPVNFEPLWNIPTGIFRCTEGEILGLGAGKCCIYKNPEYFSYHHMTYYDMHLIMRCFRQPSPNTGRKP